MTIDEVNKALNWLMENADSASQARANRLHLEDFSKSLLATLQNRLSQEHPEAAGNKLERLALAHTEYEIHLEGLKEARRIDERFKWLSSLAHAKLDVFRTIEATKRTLKI